MIKKDEIRRPSNSYQAFKDSYKNISNAKGGLATAGAVAGAVPAVLAGFGRDVFPNTIDNLSDTAVNVGDAINRGKIGETLGSYSRGAINVPLAAVQDIVNAGNTAVAPLETGVVEGLQTFFQGPKTNRPVNFTPKPKPKPEPAPQTQSNALGPRNEQALVREAMLSLLQPGGGAPVARPGAAALPYGYGVGEADAPAGPEVFYGKSSQAAQRPALPQAPEASEPVNRETIFERSGVELPVLPEKATFGDLMGYRLGNLRAGQQLLPFAAQDRKNKASRDEAREDDVMSLKRFDLNRLTREGDQTNTNNLLNRIQRQGNSDRTADRSERALKFNIVKELAGDKDADSYKTLAEEYEARQSLINNPDLNPYGAAMGEEIFALKESSGKSVMDIMDAVADEIGDGEFEDTPSNRKLILDAVKKRINAS